MQLILPRYKEVRPRVGLSLSGGGARGIAHIGVLKVLVENHIPIDFVVGTSMGSIVGGLFASGYTPDELWKIAQEIRWDEIIQDSPPRSSLFLSQKEVKEPKFLNFRLNRFKPHIPQAISPGQRLYSVLSDYILRAPYPVLNNFDDLKIPFRSLATDLISGQGIYFQRGDLARIMMASSAIPLLFSPVKMDSLLLVDGGILENIPVNYLREQKLDLIIAVDATSPLRKEDNIRLPWQLADQVTTIMQSLQKQRSRQTADIVITPKLFDRSNTDFDSLELAYAAGILAAKEALPAIFSALNDWNENSENNPSFRIDSVAMQGVPPEWPKSRFLFPNRSATASEIQNFLGRIYKTGLVAEIYAELDSSGDKNSLFVKVKSFPVLKQIKFYGNKMISDSLLLSIIDNQPGRRFNLFQWQWDRERILRLFRSHNLAKAIVLREELDFSTGVLQVFIDEGTIASIQLEGNQKTRNIVILREYPLKPGDILRADLAEEGIRNIYGLGFFERVQAEYRWQKRGIDIILHLLEKPTTLVQFSYAYDRDDRLQTQFMMTEENLFGLGNRLFISAIFGKRRYEMRSRLQSDRLFKTYITTSMEGFYYRRKHYTFSRKGISGEYLERRSGLHFSVGQQLRRIGRLSIQFRLEDLAIAPVFGTGYPISKISQTSLRLQSIVDSRDRLPFPTNGRFHHFYYEISNELFSSKVPYSKIYSSIESFYTVQNRLTIHPRLVWATADLTCPFQEMFVFTGEDAFYGFRMEEKRGRRIFNSSIDFRFFIPSKTPINTYLIAGIQYGQIWENSLAEFDLKDFMVGYGGEIAFEWLAGVFSFHYGMNSENRHEYYFRLGYQF